MKKILIPVSIIAVLLCTAAKDADQTVISPDRLFLADNGKSLFVTNRAGSELIKMSADGKEMEQKVGSVRRKLRHDVPTGRKKTFDTV